MGDGEGVENRRKCKLRLFFGGRNVFSVISRSIKIAKYDDVLSSVLFFLSFLSFFFSFLPLYWSPSVNKETKQTKNEKTNLHS